MDVDEYLVGDADAKVYLARKSALGYLVLNRPEKLNALDPDSIALIAASAVALADDTAIRAVVVRGEGRAFCAGADLAAVEALLENHEDFAAFLDDWNAAFDALATSPVPTVAAVHGTALAGGFELTHVCDYVVLARNAMFGDQHANFGLYPAGGGVQRLARLVGRRRALWALMSGEPIRAEDALAWGLVNEVTDASDTVDRAVERAQLLSTKSGRLNRELKKRLDEGLDLAVDQAIAAERPHAVAHMRSADAARGLAAFRARAVPEFT